MLTYDYINKEWVVSATAYRVYRLASCLSILLFFLSSYATVQGVPGQYLPVIRALVFAGVAGAGTSLVGMEYFLFRFDESHPLKQILWFCVMLIPMLGPALYCFIVYSGSNIVRNCLPSVETRPPTEE